MDIKVGKGAWFKTVEEAESIAKYLVQTGKLIGIRMSATLTGQNPLSIISMRLREMQLGFINSCPPL